MVQAYFKTKVAEMPLDIPMALRPHLTVPRGIDSYMPTMVHISVGMDLLLHNLSYEEGSTEWLMKHPGRMKECYRCAANELLFREAKAGADTRDLEIVDTILNDAVDLGSELAESPIERTLLPALLVADWPYVEQFPAKIKSLDATAVEGNIEPSRALIVPQLEIGKYRLDFAVIVKCQRGTFMVIVECDGREFHDRQRDYERDKFFWDLGFPTVRLTGSEINKNPFVAAEKAVHVMDLLIQQGGIK